MKEGIFVLYDNLRCEVIDCYWSKESVGINRLEEVKCKFLLKMSDGTFKIVSVNKCVAIDK